MYLMARSIINYRKPVIFYGYNIG